MQHNLLILIEPHNIWPLTSNIFHLKISPKKWMWSAGQHLGQIWWYKWLQSIDLNSPPFQNNLVCKRILNHLAKWLRFVCELSGSGFKSSCSHLNFRFCDACFKQGVCWHSGNYTIECRFTLKQVCDMTRTWGMYSIHLPHLILWPVPNSIHFTFLLFWTNVSFIYHNLICFGKVMDRDLLSYWKFACKQ